MDRTKKQDLNLAYHTICEYMLWRKGKTEQCSFTPKEVSDALETAAGAILDYIVCDLQLGIERTSLRSCEHNLKQQECITIATKTLLDETRAENRRLRAILAANRIHYRKK